MQPRLCTLRSQNSALFSSFVIRMFNYCFELRLFGFSLASVALCLREVTSCCVCLESNGGPLPTSLFLVTSLFPLPRLWPHRITRCTQVWQPLLDHLFYDVACTALAKGIDCSRAGSGRHSAFMASHDRNAGRQWQAVGIACDLPACIWQVQACVDSY